MKNKQKLSDCWAKMYGNCRSSDFALFLHIDTFYKFNTHGKYLCAKLERAIGAPTAKFVPCYGTGTVKCLRRALGDREQVKT